MTVIIIIVIRTITSSIAITSLVVNIIIYPSPTNVSRRGRRLS